MSAELEKKIVEVLSQEEGKALNLEGIASECRIDRSEMDELEWVIHRLEGEGRLVKKGSRRYRLAVDGDYLEGRFKQHRNGDGVVILDDENEADIFIPSGSQGGAFLHDIVRVRVRKSRPDEGGPFNHHEFRGTVVAVLKRAFAEVVGTFRSTPDRDICNPDDPRFPPVVWIESRRGKLDPAEGDKVVVQLVEYGDGSSPPTGKLVAVLGPPDGRGVDIASIVRQYSLPLNFPPEVQKEAGELPEFLRKSDYNGRTDCRDHLVITIDPDDARDFDDAISVRKLDNGDFRVWVHIADVSHFVRPGSALDAEARERGNSTYLVDRVIPMLPENLSNGLCSLQPNVDRLTKCLEADIDPSGVVRSWKLYPAVIHSRRRYTYQEAMEVIDGKGQSDTDKMVRLGWEIASKLRSRRMQNGSLDMDFPDRKIRLDSEGRIKAIEIMENDESHQLIEEFMLVANECVARELRKRKTPSLFRIHEDPAKERLRELEEQMRKSQIYVKNLHRPGNLNRLMTRIHKHPAASALSVSVLRSLKRARYSTKPIGHFGLAKKDYTHFTSPIRRYADLVVHRSIFDKVKLDTAAMVKIADHISATERNSADAEYDSRIVKLQRYLDDVRNDPVSGVFNAVVTEVRAKGLFVDLPELGVSGMVPIRSLGTDSYKFSRATSSISARRSGKSYSIGSNIRVRVLKIDKANRFFDFAAVDPGWRGTTRTNDTRSTSSGSGSSGKRNRTDSGSGKKSFSGKSRSGAGGRASQSPRPAARDRDADASEKSGRNKHPSGKSSQSARKSSFSRSASPAGQKNSPNTRKSGETPQSAAKSKPSTAEKSDRKTSTSTKKVTSRRKSTTARRKPSGNTGN